MGKRFSLSAATENEKKKKKKRKIMMCLGVLCTGQGRLYTHCKNYFWTFQVSRDAANLLYSMKQRLWTDKSTVRCLNTKVGIEVVVELTFSRRYRASSMILIATSLWQTATTTREHHCKRGIAYIDAHANR